jgi:hypothetical protein
MSYRDLPRSLAQKLSEWESIHGDLSQLIETRRDQVHSDLSRDEKLRTLICDFVSAISDQQQRDQLSAIIKISRQITPLPKIPLTDAAVDILIVIILELCGRKREAEKFLISSALGILLSMLIYDAWKDLSKSKRRRKTRR